MKEEYKLDKKLISCLVYFRLKHAIIFTQDPDKRGIIGKEFKKEDRSTFIKILLDSPLKASGLSFSYSYEKESPLFLPI